MIGVGVGLPFVRSSGAGAPGGGGALKPQDVFKIWTWTGTGASQTLTGAPDLSGKDWMLHAKNRTSPYGHTISDTKRGLTNQLVTNTTMYQQNYGFSLSAGANSITIGQGDLWINASSQQYTGFVAVDAPKFLRIVTWTGNDVPSRVITHNLGASPGMIWLKAFSSATGAWNVWHKSATGNLYLNYTDAQDTGTNPVIASVTSTSFTIGANQTGTANTSGVAYIAYVWADDPSGVISCGTFTPVGGIANVDLGWRPQWMLVRRVNQTDNWYVIDAVRGWSAGAGRVVCLDTADPEITVDLGDRTTSGFNLLGSNVPYIYMAIREPY